MWWIGGFVRVCVRVGMCVGTCVRVCACTCVGEDRVSPLCGI